MNKPSRDEILKLAGEPVGMVCESHVDGPMYGLNGATVKEVDLDDSLVQVGDKLYTEAQALALYAAGLARATPEGYVLVPVEPTPEMYAAVDNERLAQLYWRKLIATLPITTTEGEQGCLSQKNC